MCVRTNLLSARPKLHFEIGTSFVLGSNPEKDCFLNLACHQGQRHRDSGVDLSVCRNTRSCKTSHVDHFWASSTSLRSDRPGDLAEVEYFLIHIAADPGVFPELMSDACSLNLHVWIWVSCQRVIIALWLRGSRKRCACRLTPLTPDFYN